MKNNAMSKKLFAIKSEVPISACVEAGSSTSAVSKRGLIDGITKRSTATTEAIKKRIIIVG